MKEDPEILEENEELREKIIEFLTVYFLYMKELNKLDEFKIFLCPIMKFLNEINTKIFYPSKVL